METYEVSAPVSLNDPSYLIISVADTLVVSSFAQVVYNEDSLLIEGENPSRVYSMTRMDSGWNFRNAYNEAKKIKVAQDEFCMKAEKGEWHELGKFPESLQWEALVDVLRGRVKVCLFRLCKMRY